MRKLIVKLELPFKPFLDRAKAIIEAHGYKDEDPVKVAMHQAVIHQEDAFNIAINLIKRSSGYSVSVEPVELLEGNETVIYEATYILPRFVDITNDPDMLNPKEFVQSIKDSFPENRYTLT